MTIQPRYLVGAIAGLALGALLIFGGAWNVLAQGSGPNASNALLTCEPTQQVVVRHVVVNKELQLSMQCVTSPGAGAVRYQNEDDWVAPVQRAQSVSAVRTVRAPARAAATTRTAAQPEEPKRSWKTSALIIGGAAGAGAGIGGIADGKKGALIGAAIGAGAASIFEAIKRN